MTVELLPLLGVDNPYPGLRPFEAHEAFLFHGRQDHTRALLERLSTDRFLAVVGTSGSGKSSLVRAGLLPALYRGYLVGASSRWRIAVMRPGNAPLDELAGALASQALRTELAPLRRAIGRTSLGLVTSIQSARLDPDENVLIVVDQFEELFRFERERHHQDGGAEASLFVQSLIQAADTYGARLFVVITMRSDYLGQCAQFAGLPEALNRGQYLIPHLTREQRREAIEKPPLVANARIKPALAQQLLNDMGDDPGQLPVLQHALMRTFRRLRQSVGSELDFEHYARAGGLAYALDQHADSIMESLPPGPRRWVEPVFRALTTREGGRVVRRPARLDRLFEVLGVTADEAACADVRTAIEAFAIPENSLLVSSTGLPLTPGSVIDISHESLIRNWRRLQQWLLEETRSAEWFLSLARDTLRFRDGDASPWRDPELARVLQHKETGRWNDAWARQYLPQADPPYDEVMRFVDESVRTQKEERAQREAQRKKEIDDAKALAASETRRKRAYMIAWWAAVVLFGFLSYQGLNSYRKQRADTQAARDLARTQVGAARVEQLAAEREALQLRLREADQQLQRARASGQDVTGLQKRIDDLERSLQASTVAYQNASQPIQQTAGAADDHDAERKQIADLQNELKKVRAERDKLQADQDTYTTLQVRDASYWKSRWNEVEAEARQLRARVGAASGASTEPVVLAVPLASSVRLDDPPFGGRAHLLYLDPGRSKTLSPNLFVVLPKSKTGPPEFVGNEKAATAVAYQWLAKARCPGYSDEDDKTIWCFDIGRAQTSTKPQPLGRFTFGGTTFSLVATGWASNPRSAEPDGTTVIIFPSRGRAAASRTPTR